MNSTACKTMVECQNFYPNPEIVINIHESSHAYTVRNLSDRFEYPDCFFAFFNNYYMLGILLYILNVDKT